MAVDLLPMMEGNKAWSPEKWSPRHRLIVSLHMGGHKNSEIAEMMGVSASLVSNTLNDPRAAYEIQNLATTVADRTVDTALRIRLYANEALDEVVEELRTSRNEKVRQSAAFGLLDRAGYTPVREVKEVAPPMLPKDVVERMEVATREMVEYKGNYREVVPTPTADEPVSGVSKPDPGAPRGKVS